MTRNAKNCNSQCRICFLLLQQASMVWHSNDTESLASRLCAVVVCLLVCLLACLLACLPGTLQSQGVSI
jgi:hypothetical protein